MATGGITRLCEQIAEVASVNCGFMYDNWEAGITSPIERLFMAGVSSILDMETSRYFHFRSLYLWDGRKARTPELDKNLEAYGSVLLEYQKTELDWRADFVLSVPTYGTKKVIIECDGHAFHAATKEQAAKDRSRDRAAQAAGYTILRFTGSELYRDPLKCVCEALDALPQFEA